VLTRHKFLINNRLRRSPGICRGTERRYFRDAAPLIASQRAVSSRPTASSGMVAVAWLYRSSVVVTVEWPRRYCATLGPTSRNDPRHGSSSSHRRVSHRSRHPRMMRSRS